MSILNERNCGQLLKSWFQKSIFNFDILKFDEFDIYSEILTIFKFDYLRYYPHEESILILKLLNNIPLQSILTYRIANYYYKLGEEDSALLFSNLGRFLTGIELYYSSSIGKAFKINHGLGTVIGARCKVGNNVLIHQNVTLGDRNEGRPTIEDNVIIYAGVIILGDITIGSNSIIGANSVVLKSAPSNSILIGIPAKIK
jgi:serine O-acetyltransferase